jgi:hypothetical protein
VDTGLGTTDGILGFLLVGSAIGIGRVPASRVVEGEPAGAGEDGGHLRLAGELCAPPLQTPGDAEIVGDVVDTAPSCTSATASRVNWGVKVRRIRSASWP